MKKNIVLFIVILLFSFNSCSDSIPELWGEQKNESQKDSDNYFESSENLLSNSFIDLSSFFIFIFIKITL